MEAHVNTDLVSRFLRRVEGADERFDYLTCLRDLFGALELASGGLSYSEGSGSQRVLWNAPDKRIVQCSRELTENGRHPTIRIAASRQYPFALYDFESEFSKDRCASQLIQQFKNTGLDNTYAVPVHAPRDMLHIFVLGKKGQRLSSEALLALQAACQGVVAKMTRAAERNGRDGRWPVVLGDRGGSLSRQVERLSFHGATGNIFHFPERRDDPGRTVHRSAPHAGKVVVPPDIVSSEVGVLLSALDVLWERYDVAIEAGDQDLMSMLSGEILSLARRIDESDGSLLLMHVNDNAVRHE